MTQPENTTGKRTEIVVIIHAKGVLDFGVEEAAISSTPQACGLFFHHPGQRRDLIRRQGGFTASIRRVRVCDEDMRSSPG